MNDSMTESESRNAAKVAGFVAATALTATLAIKAKRFVGNKIRNRRLTPSHLIADE